MQWSFVFFKQKAAYEMRISDWSSDVCSSDLTDRVGPNGRPFGLVPDEEPPIRSEAPQAAEGPPVRSGEHLSLTACSSECRCVRGRYEAEHHVAATSSRARLHICNHRAREPPALGSDVGEARLSIDRVRGRRKCRQSVGEQGG